MGLISTFWYYKMQTHGKTCLLYRIRQQSPPSRVYWATQSRPCFRLFTANFSRRLRPRTPHMDMSEKASENSLQIHPFQKFLQNPDPSGACGGLFEMMNFSFHITIKCIDFIRIESYILQSTKCIGNCQYSIQYSSFVEFRMENMPQKENIFWIWLYQIIWC